MQFMNISVFFLYLLRVAKQEKISLDKALNIAKNLGYDALDIDKEEVKNYPDAVKKIKSAGLKIVNVYGEYDLLNGKCDDAKELIDCALTCGAKIAMLLPGVFDESEFPEDVKSDTAAMYKFLESDKKVLRALEAIKKTVEYAKQKGVYLTIESFGSPRSLTSYISQIEWLISKVDGLKFTFDIGNFYLNGQDIFSAYEKFNKHSVHVHCKDYLTFPPVKSKEFSYAKISVPVGNGQAPIKEIAKMFLDSGYDGYFTAEYLGVENSLKIITKSAEFLKSIK